MKGIVRASLILSIPALASPAAGEQERAQPLAIPASDAGLQWGPCPPIFPGACQIAVLHGAPTLPNADIFLRVGPGYVLPLHRHTSAERMVLVSGALQVRYEGTEEVTLTPGTYAYGPPGRAHEGRCVSLDACTLFIAFEGPVDAELIRGAAQ